MSSPVSAHSGDRSGLGWLYTLASRINRRSKRPLLMQTCQK